MPDNATRTQASRNDSKGSAAASVEIRIRLFRDSIKPSCRDIVFELFVPGVLVALANKGDELSEFFRRKLINCVLNFCQAHDVDLTTG
jgi:hypothetical protein